MTDIEIKIRELLKGIDKIDSENFHGWWSTQYGADFGSKKLEELISLVNSL